MIIHMMLCFVFDDAKYDSKKNKLLRGVEQSKNKANISLTILKNNKRKKKKQKMPRNEDRRSTSKNKTTSITR